MNDNVLEKMIATHMEAISKAEREGKEWWNFMHDYRHKVSSLERIGTKTLKVLEELDQTDEVKLLVYQWKEILPSKSLDKDRIE